MVYRRSLFEYRMGASQSKDEKYPYLRSSFHSRSSRSLFVPLLSGLTTQCDDGSSAPPPPPPPSGGVSNSSTTEAPPPPPSAEDDSISEAAQKASAYTNPGPYEMVAQDSKRLVTLDTFDGFRCDINKQLSPYMVAIHNFWLGTNMIPDGRKNTYAFVCQVADESGLWMARVDPGRGSVDGRIHRAILGGLCMAKLQLGLSQEGQGDQALAELDFGAETWTANIKYGSMGGGIAYGCNYFQAVTPRIAMGGEAMFIGANNGLMSNYTLRYTMPAKTGEEDLSTSKASEKNEQQSENAGSSTLWASYNTMSNQVSLSYKRVVTPNRVSLGADLSFDPLSLQSQVMLGAEFKLTRSKLNFCVDGSAHIQSTLETKLGMMQGAPSLSFSADVDHMKEDMKFGYGLNFEG